MSDWMCECKTKSIYEWMNCELVHERKKVNDDGESKVNELVSKWMNKRAGEQINECGNGK